MKARYVGGGHLTKVSPPLSYLSVVARDSVRIMFLVAALNELNIKICRKRNVYLNAETRERLWFTVGKEWNIRAGCKVIIVRALYGLKFSGAECKKTFSSYIKNTLGYTPCIVADDNDEDRTEYYSYIVVCVDDVFFVHKDLDKVLATVNREYKRKESLECPTIYLGADICRYHINGNIAGAESCAMSVDSYVKKAVEVVQERLRDDNIHFKGIEYPFFSQSYRPEFDVTEECNDEQVQFYLSLVGIMRWLCKIGRLTY